MYDQEIDGVAFATDLTQKSFNLKNAPGRRLAFTKDRLFMYSPVFIYRKKSLLTAVIDRKLQMLRETGLIEFWIENNIDDRNTKSEQKGPSRLQIENVLAAFQICGFMYLISFIVFIIEINCAKYPRIKFVIDYLTY